MGRLRRVQRGLKTTHIVQDRLVLRDRNVLRLLTRRNSALLDTASIGATLGCELHELLEGLREGTNVGQLATGRCLTRRIVVNACGLAILSLHDGFGINGRGHLLTCGGVDTIHTQHTKAIGAILLDGSLKTRLRNGSRTRNHAALLRELGLIGHTQFIGRAGQ